MCDSNNHNCCGPSFILLHTYLRTVGMYDDTNNIRLSTLCLMYLCALFFFSLAAVYCCSPGRRTGLTSSSAVSFEETERLLDESEWATGASSWRLDAVTTEEARDEDGDQIEAAAAAASSELLSLVRKKDSPGVALAT